MYRLSLQASQDIIDIWDYIAQDNPTAADKVEAQFKDAFTKLAANPYLGHKREELTEKPVRFWGVHSYQIIYDPQSQPLVILRILSGYRDISAIFED